MNPADHIVPGSLWHKQTVNGQLPPLVPAQPLEDDSNWDTNFLGWYVAHQGDPSIERRHSGWAAVEKQWTQKNSGPATKVEQKPPSKEVVEVMSQLHPGLSLPPPGLEMDFRMKVVLNANVATMAVGAGSKKWTTFTEGVWSGNLGTGTVIGGGQDSIDMECGQARGTQIESTFKLKTIDEPPAMIDCKMRGFRTGPNDIMTALTNTAQAQAQAPAIDPRQYRHRVVITMRTNDSRYAEKVNFELWIGTCLWRGSEVIYDAYKIH